MRIGKPSGASTCLAWTTRSGVIGSCGSYRHSSHDRSGLADRVGPADRRPRADGTRCRRGGRAAQDALVAAPGAVAGVGRAGQPGAWLMATAKHRAIDLLRRNKRIERKHEELGYQLASRHVSAAPDLDAASTMMSATTCRAWSSPPATPFSPPRASHSLRLLGGLTTEEMRVRLVPEPTIAQRIIAPSERSPRSTFPLKCPRLLSSPSGCRLCSK